MIDFDIESFVQVAGGSGDREVEERFVSSSTAFIGICLEGFAWPRRV